MDNDANGSNPVESEMHQPENDDDGAITYLGSVPVDDDFMKVIGQTER